MANIAPIIRNTLLRFQPLSLGEEDTKLTERLLSQHTSQTSAVVTPG